MVRRLRAAGLDLETRVTSAPGEAVEIVAECVRHGARRFLAVGGDGTAFEVLNGCLGKAPVQERLRLALLPLGTGNSLLSDLGLLRGRRVEQILLADRARSCDVLRLVTTEGERFMMGHFGIGFAAEVAELVNRRLKRWGVMAYLLGVLLSLRRLHTSTLRAAVDGDSLQRREATFVFVNNSRTVGGNMRMAPEASPFDGVADLVWVDPVPVGTLLLTLPRLFWGRHVTHPAVHVRQLHELVLDCTSAVPLLLDGEVEIAIPHRVELLPGAVDLVC